MKPIIRLLIYLLPALVFAQDNLDNQLKSNRSQLEKVKSEIESLKDRLQTTAIQTSSALEQVTRLDHEVNLIEQVVKLLERESDLLQIQITTTQNNLDNYKNNLTKLQEEYALRVVHNYKYGKLQTLELLFTAGSLNRALVRYKYLQFFSEQEKKLIQKIKLNITKVTELGLSLTSQLREHKISREEKALEREKLFIKKNEKTALISRLQWNRNTLKQELDLREKEYQRLFNLIATLEKQRKAREAKRNVDQPQFAANFENFKKAKGNLPWPVAGNVLHKFGKQMHASLKTYTNNTGIDIKSGEGSKVKLIFPGVVSMVTYLPGFGKTVIFEHGEGFYTVYSHLSEVYVTRDLFVRVGETIGLVGDTGSLEGSKLHFEIYGGENALDPLKWLQKK